MTIHFKTAKRFQKKLRMAIHGPSGSGKSLTALLVGQGLGSKIAVIDTERGSASLYADRVPFDVIELDYFSVDNYIAAINAAVEAGYEVLIIDSLSHAWVGLGGVLDAVNNTKGNTFTDGWGKTGTPQQNRLMDAILNAPLHVIATMRVKTDYDVEKDERGKSVPRKVGLAPVQRDGVEYEYDIVGAMDENNRLTITKSRYIDLAGRFIDKPSQKLGEQLLGWLNAGAPEPPKYKVDDVPVFRKILAEESAKLTEWRSKDKDALVGERVAIIECYKSVKGVATSIDLQAVVTQHPATPSMSASQILDAAVALETACRTALNPKRPHDDSDDITDLSAEKLTQD